MARWSTNSTEAEHVVRVLLEATSTATQRVGVVMKDGRHLFGRVYTSNVGKDPATEMVRGTITLEDEDRRTEIDALDIVRVLAAP